ncbi:MAG: selenocysteine-specific translation elongation factor [Comamonas sp.]
MIIGTAGHIDHGKTTLVRALTGVDTDRLKEEKARGISIELGYAYVPLPNGDTVGIIDVPGHEKFVHTMVAGAVGVEHMLLVVAADDGVMPQTQEHLAIVQLLGVQHATVAITKADRVSDEQLATVHASVNALLASTPFAGAPLFNTSATQPQDTGTAALRNHLWQQAAQFAKRRHQGLFRLAIDRVFSLPGQGTVVTGTVFSGQVQVGDSVVHSASGQTVRVRSIHTQNQASDTGAAGQRCALNLAGIAKEDIHRGDWIAAPGTLQASNRIDVHISTTGDAPALTQWLPVHVHLGTWHGTAHIALLGSQPITAGSQARAQLVLDAPVFALPGDRIIVRNAQANQTIAGGTVLDPYAPARKRNTPERIAYLDALQTMIASGNAQPVLAQAPYGMAASMLQRLCGRSQLDLPTASHVRWPLADNDALLLASERASTLQQRVLEVLAKFHTQYVDEPGINSARLRRMALPGLQQSNHDALWQGLLAQLLAEQHIAQTGAWLHAPGHSVQLTAAEQQLAERLLPSIHNGRYDPPWVRDLANDHGAAEPVVRQLLGKLARQGQLYQIVKDLFYHPARMDELAQLVHQLASAAEGQAVPAAAFRDATGLGRKRAIQLLEYFDRVGYTRRWRDTHVLRPGVVWNTVR